uniref:Rab-GAP TBC domain-containing protein n=1 Tax=Strigamia maritima TaxID=126957 RepID=T1IJ52_STRMM
MLSLSYNIRSSSGSESCSRSKVFLLKKISPGMRYLWIRLALFEKQLAKIIDHLVQNSSKYYERDALVSDPVEGPILASLLVGPCALDYSKMKTQDHFWTDPPADELVQRHRISSIYPTVPSTPPMGRRPGLNFRRPLPTGNSEENVRSAPVSAREYVESLHQNSKATLLYGKNNVLVQPRENMEPLPGYLSLHQVAETLTIKWTPNQLMNGCVDGTSVDNKEDKSLYWDYAINVNVSEVVYVHCHQQADIGGTVVLVGQDGVQRPPIHFPKGGHLLQFLSCLENGLLPHGQLDPPLWSQRGKGKVFPKLRRKGRTVLKRSDDSLEEDDESSDYVFRILNKIKPENISQELMDPKFFRGSSFAWLTSSSSQKESNAPISKRNPSTRSSSSTSSTKSLSLNDDGFDFQFHRPLVATVSNDKSGRDSLQVLCATMKRQIISRAFYGCKHLRTVRTHLSGLVNISVVSVDDPSGALKGLTEEVWKSMHKDGMVHDAMEVHRLTYFGGVQPDIRKEVWPYLLGHYQFGSAEEDRRIQNLAFHQQYETTMSEWLAVEAIVRQRDKETMAAQLAKLSSESTSNGEIPLVGRDQTLSNDVFEDSVSLGSEENLKLDETKPSEQQEGVNLVVDHENPETEAEIDQNKLIVVSNPSMDSGNLSEEADKVLCEDDGKITLAIDENLDGGSQGSSCLSPASSNGGVYPTDLLDAFALNLHRIDKDVQRCDRNYKYFAEPDNLEKLRNVMCTYVWEHLEVGYVQGMCDLVAPLLVIFNDESLTYSCLCELMKRMATNFPHGGAMDAHFANMRSMIQILDSEMFELMHQNGDYTHFYFCYRWFLLDFKRELIYEDVFSIWETIWSARHVASANFVLFIALAFVEYYRDIILNNNMDFTDIIKFFNEMAEHHNAKEILTLARDLVLQLQTLIDNK